MLTCKLLFVHGVTLRALQFLILLLENLRNLKLLNGLKKRAFQNSYLIEGAVIDKIYCARKSLKNINYIVLIRL